MNDLFADHIPFLRPWLGEEEAQAAAQVILSGWVSQGPRGVEFENAVAGYVGARFGVATNACTSALHLSLLLSGVEPGDEVIVPSWTCMATANAIHHAGGRPVFAEIDPRTYNLDPLAAAQAITPRTRAILVVHQIGLAADMDAFFRLAAERGLKLVEDGACSLGGAYKGRRVGGLGSPTCFSFHPRKTITSGEGGMIATNDERLAGKARVLRSTGASISDLVRHQARGTLVQQYHDVGYNYRLTDIQAAVGLVQFGKIQAILEERARQARRYDQALAAFPEVVPPYVPEYATHAYTSYAIRLREGCGVSRDGLLQFMAEHGVSCRTGIQPLHLEPYYRESCRGLRLPVTEEAARSTLFLPIFPGLTEAQQERVLHVLEEGLTSCRTHPPKA